MKFGRNHKKNWPITFGINTKGQMDKDEFKDYVTKALIPLFPDSEDVLGK